jgi:hypothetical protein
MSLFVEYRRKIIRYTDASVRVAVRFDFYCFFGEEEDDVNFAFVAYVCLDTFVDRTAESCWKPWLDFCVPVVWWLLCFDCLRSTIPPSSVAVLCGT